jgi:hypothetical protein
MSTRRYLGNLLLISVATLGLVAGGSAVALAQSRTTTPVGRWEGTVATSFATFAVGLSFHPGTVCTGPGGPGPGAEGAGIWWSTGTNGFTFVMVERFFDETGTTTGWLTTQQSARQSGDSFTSSGQSHFFDADWVYQFSESATINVARLSPTPGAC